MKKLLLSFISLFVLVITNAQNVGTGTTSTTKPLVAKPVAVKPATVAAKKNTAAPVAKNPVVLTNVAPGLEWDNASKTLLVDKGYTIKKNPDHSIVIFKSSQDITDTNHPEGVQAVCSCQPGYCDESGLKCPGTGSCGDPDVNYKTGGVSCALGSSTCSGDCLLYINAQPVGSTGQGGIKNTWINVAKMKPIAVQ